MSLSMSRMKVSLSVLAAVCMGLAMRLDAGETNEQAKASNDIWWQISLPLLVQSYGADLGLTSLQQPVRGARLEGLIACSEDLRGVQVGGLMSVVRNDVTGLQVGGLVNGAKCVTGIQVGGFLNAVDGDVTGIQVGEVNASGSLKGVQIGLLNQASSLKGVQIGLLNKSSGSSVMSWWPIINFGF